MKNFVDPMSVKKEIGELTQPMEYGTMPPDPWEILEIER